MPKAAVVGSPVAHSLSPVLHRAAYAELGIPDWTYEAVECREAELAGLLAGLDTDWVGLSVTMPLKRQALLLADESTGLAQAVGAANTLLLSTDDAGRRLVLADNTDVGGMVDALRAAGVGGATRAVVLGAGGTAQAALAALSQLAVAEVVVVVRDLARTAQLRATADRLGLEPHIMRWSGWSPDAPADEIELAAVRDSDLIVSTVPAGVADPLAGIGIRAGQVVFDVVYDPWPTALAAAASAAGATVLSGLDLLVHQAVRQVRLMTERQVDAAVLYRAVEAARTGADDDGSAT